MTRDDGVGRARDALTIPSWVPEPVAQVASVAHRLKSGEYTVVLQRLLVDPRMPRVWRELARRKRRNYRSTEAFLHSSKLEWVNSDDPADSQSSAMTSLLYFALNLALDSPRVMTRQELEGLRRKVLEEASTLRIAAKSIHRRAPSQAAAVQVNIDTARACEALLERTGKNRLIVQRDSGDAQTRCFAILFAERCHELFGSPLYGVTAIVTSVALGCPVTARAARGWHPPHPADKGP